KWPFYSAVMAAISYVTGLSLTHSAFVFNAVCYAWMTLAFIALVRLMGGNKATLWFAALVILAFPTINKFRPTIIRDPAFYALFLSACYAYFLYLKEGHARYNIISILAFSFSALFRIEGFIYLFVTQAYILGRHFFYKTNRVLGLVALFSLLLMMVVLISWWQFTPNGEMSYLSLFTEPVRFLETVWLQVLEQMGQRLHAIETKVLVGYSQSYSVIVLLWSAMTIVFFELLHALYYLYFILWFIAWRKGLLFPEPKLYRPWRYLISVALLILLGFVVIKWFLSERYPLTVSLLMLLAVPFLLASWRENIKLKKIKAGGYWLVLTLIVLSGVKSLDLATKKTYLKDAGYWMAQNLPAGASVYTNNRIIEHYYGHEAKVDFYWPFWEQHKTAVLLGRQHFEYAAINIKHGDKQHIANTALLIDRKVLAEYINEKGNRLIIFDLKQSRQAVIPPPIHSR
ncbi:MAG: hypothetical protein V3V09_03980, partial [Arenicellales bacterium]